MKRYFVSILLALIAIAAVHGQSPESVVKYTPLILPAGATSGKVEGKLEDGVKIPLDWAEGSSVACFPSTRFEMFDGHHVFYRVNLPA